MSTSSPPTTDFFAGYASATDCFDEVRADGPARAAWQRLGEHLGALGLPELQRREEAAIRQLQENGATYNVHGDAFGGDHPWQLDLVPCIVHEREWKTLADGLAQRARLLDLLLADLYGPQTALREGLLPPEIVYDNPAYLRACHGLPAAGGNWLHFYGVDLARGPDGQWRVLGDLTQMPAGAGYVLENRIVLSRLLADHFRDSQVERLAHFFQRYRETLLRLSPRPRDNPRIVMLSNGPQDVTYFEHAFLARYLGQTLVEGEDLAVREQTAWLKMLGGLQPVDVIVRRVEDSACDPLELGGPAARGVPGLLQVLRSGAVSVVNALGSGLLESEAILPFLPGLCRHFLSEDLLVPSVATWWCGQPDACAYVLEHLDDLSVLPAMGDATALPVTSRADLAAAIAAAPHRYVAQERLRFSSVPSLDGDRIAARRLFLRTYLTATPDGYDVMPGGLARAVEAPTGAHEAVAAGGVSKDLWIVSDQPVSEFSLLPTGAGAIELSRGGGDLPSRAADNLFWLGRYAERADAIIRLARLLLIRLSERPEGASMPHLARYAIALGDADAPLLQDEASYDFLETKTLAFLFNDQVEGGLRQTVDGVRRVAGIARDRLSAETWRMLNRMELNLEEMSQSRRVLISEVVEMLDRMLIRLAAFAGTSLESMTRGQGWRFLDIGRRLERCAQLLKLIQFAMIPQDAAEPAILDDVLAVADCSITYRRRYVSSLRDAPVLDLLLTDETNPRSLLFQLEAIEGHVGQLPRDDRTVGLTEEQRLIARSLARVRLADIAQLAAPGPDYGRWDLFALVKDVQDTVPLLSDALTRHYLSHARPSRQLDTVRLGGAPD
ncbi:MAG TPA: circularly permuted type 2 ATP-grasp protein [Kiritimatiellia bacterium]|nr:circularly permuted type 2 ATP-grasp protein [Kiritimatiellia bacterium]